MKNLISKLLIKLIGRKNLISFIDVDSLMKKRENKIISKNIKKIILGNNSFIYKETVISNFQNYPEKIIVGNDTHIRGELLVFNYGGSISIGNNCFIGEGTRIWSGEDIFIGNNVLISHNVNIIDTNSHEINHLERAERYKDLMKNGHWDDKGNILTNPIIIKDYAWISFNASILKGVTIGKGAIVAAGSVVTKNVDDFTIVAGNPAVEIKKLKN